MEVDSKVLGESWKEVRGTVGGVKCNGAQVIYAIL